MVVLGVWGVARAGGRGDSVVSYRACGAVGEDDCLRCGITGNSVLCLI